MKWNADIDAAPMDMPILVFGGVWEGEINGTEPNSGVMLVTQEYSRGQFYVVGTDGYASWVRNPTHWMPLPEVPSAEERSDVSE